MNFDCDSPIQYEFEQWRHLIIPYSLGSKDKPLWVDRIGRFTPGLYLLVLNQENLREIRREVCRAQGLPLAVCAEFMALVRLGMRLPLIEGPRNATTVFEASEIVLEGLGSKAVLMPATVPETTDDLRMIRLNLGTRLPKSMATWTKAGDKPVFSTKRTRRKQMSTVIIDV